jgi:transcriptional regulator of acetoin/glycerol metabolism
MLRNTLPDPDTLRGEIEASHNRSRQFGIDPLCTRNTRQPKLSDEELAKRREKNSVFLEVAIAQMQELYLLVAGAGFMMAVVDRDGYMLDIVGDPPVLAKLETGNCRTGYRWTERDVGTAAISLALERRIPVQLNDQDHYCKRGHGHTSSASPVFDAEDNLLGVLAMAGEVQRVHPHTLGMVITAARAIENQLRTIKTSQELLLRNS